MAGHAKAGIGIGVVVAVAAAVGGAVSAGGLTADLEVLSITAGVGAPTGLSSSDSGKLINNTGTTVKAACTLPAAAAGRHYYVQNVDSDGFRVNAATGDVIRLGDTTGASAGYVETLRVGSTLHLVGVDGDTWLDASPVGTWRFDSTTSAGYAFTPTPWTSTTYTGSWSSNTTYVGMARQVGDVLEGRVSVRLAGAPTSAELTIGMPTFEGTATAINHTKLLTSNGSADGLVALGAWAYLDSGTASRIGGWVTTRGDFSTATAIRFFLGTSIAATGLSDATGVTQAAPVTFANGDRINLAFSVPIQ